MLPIGPMVPGGCDWTWTKSSWSADVRVTYSLLSSMFWKWKQAYHWRLGMCRELQSRSSSRVSNFCSRLMRSCCSRQTGFRWKTQLSGCVLSASQDEASVLCCVVSVRVWDTHVKFCCSSSSPRRDSTSVCTHKISQASWKLWHLTFHYRSY